MRKTIFIAALVAASFSAKAQTEKPYIGIKCPVCPTLIKLDYEQDGFKEILKNPDFRATWIIDWETNTIECGGKKYRFKHYTDDTKKSVTVEWLDGSVVMLIENYYTDKAAYIGSKFGK